MPANQVKANPEIRPIGPITEKDKPALLEAARQGWSVKETARKTGLSENQVVTGRRKFGIKAEPVNNAHQVQASASFAARARVDRHNRYEAMQRIQAKLLADLEEDLTSGQVTTILRGVQGIEGEEVVTKLPARDLRERMSAITAQEVQLQKIAAIDDDGGLARGLSMLEKFRQAAEVLVGGTLPTPREGLIQE